MLLEALLVALVRGGQGVLRCNWWQESLLRRSLLIFLHDLWSSFNRHQRNAFIAIGKLLPTPKLLCTVIAFLPHHAIGVQLSWQPLTQKSRRRLELLILRMVSFRESLLLGDTPLNVVILSIYLINLLWILPRLGHVDTMRRGSVYLSQYLAQWSRLQNWPLYCLLKKHWCLYGGIRPCTR